MNKKLRRCRIPIGVSALECRTLLSASLPTGTWIGQDAHDLVGPYSNPGPDGVQDIHIALSDLPADRTVVQANITGYQGGQWMYNGPPNGPWAAAFLRTPGSTDADLYLDPYQVETGRYFFAALTYDDQSTVTFSILGGTADPNLRMPGQSVSGHWVGQDGQDWTGPGASVGPEGFQDAHVTLANLSTDVSIQSATLSSSGGQTWAIGTNPNLLAGAELFQHSDDRSIADVYFSPTTDLNGQTLTLTVFYANGKSDTTSILAGATDPALRMPAPTPVAVSWDAFVARWVGQDGQNPSGPGDVHIALSGLPLGRSVKLAQLGDSTLNTWDYSTPGASLFDANPNALPLTFGVNPADSTRADVYVSPVRDESHTNLTLRLVLDDGTNLVARLAGGASDLGLRAPDIASTSVAAHPGDDLNVLANQFGTVHLTAGTYNLSTPLVLNNPVTLTADPGVTLLFAQGADQPAWTAAIKINASHTTLDGFAVRFAGPVRWNQDVSYGPSVIGTTDNFDTGPNVLKVNVTLTRLDLMSPPASSDWEGAPSLIRVVSAINGVISGNTLKGGTTEFIGGPWQVVDNTYEGTVPGSYTSTAFAGHYTHDVVIANNHAEPVGASGKAYRFLVLTQAGVNDVVQNNTVVGIGPMDSDTHPNPNATEVVLTESYRLLFEGKPASISADGRIVQISSVQAGAVEAGAVIAILSGPQAGQWRQISLVINPTTYLMSSPIDPATDAVSIANGFVNESFIGNTIDTRGSSTAADLDLARNHFGVKVLSNHFLGGNAGFFISAYASETPSIYGWSHAPILGATISGNTVEDTVLGGLLNVLHDGATRADVGRVYLTAALTNNTGIWTPAYVAQSGSASPRRAFTVGMAPSNDAGDLVVTVSGNQAEGPAGVVAGETLLTVSATVNGVKQTNQGTVLPVVTIAAPSGLALVNDTGASTTDGRTDDLRLSFDPVPLAVGYEYSPTGNIGTYVSIGSSVTFLPQGMVSGFDTIYVRAYDASGNRGPDALILFAYDSSVAVGSTGSNRPVRYEYRIGGDGTYVPLGTSIMLTAAQEANGPPALQIHLIDTKGVTPPVAPTQPVATPIPDPTGTSTGSSPIASTPPSVPTSPVTGGLTGGSTPGSPTPSTPDPNPVGSSSDAGSSPSAPSVPTGGSAVPASGTGLPTGGGISSTATTPSDGRVNTVSPASPGSSVSTIVVSPGNDLSLTQPASSRVAVQGASGATPVPSTSAPTTSTQSSAFQVPGGNFGAAAARSPKGILTHGPHAIRHPNPFRRTGGSSLALHAQSLHKSRIHSHPKAMSRAIPNRTKGP